MNARDRLAQLIAEQIGTHRGAQSELSRRLGEKDDHWVSDRMTNKAQIKADELPRIAEALGKSPCAFFEEVKPAVADRLYQAVVGVLRQSGDIPAESPAKPKPALGSPEYKRRQAMNMTARLARSFAELPGEEQEAVWAIVEERKRLREREGKAEQSPERKQP